MGKIDKSALYKIAEGNTGTIVSNGLKSNSDTIADVINSLDDDLNICRQQPTGLKFKSGDNNVNFKSPEINLGLDDFTVELWARTEGSNGVANSIIGNSKTPYAPYCFRIYGNTTYGSNRIDYLLMQRELDELSNGLKNSVHIDKQDTTPNLHHIVITRSGRVMTAIINGRLVKSVTQDRVLDFSKFVFDIANTSFFSLGRVFNYAMSQEESNKLLWNGGRCDEVVIGNGYKGNYNIKLNAAITANKNTVTTYANPISDIYLNMKIGDYYYYKIRVVKKPTIIPTNSYIINIGDNYIINQNSEVGLYVGVVKAKSTICHYYLGTNYNETDGEYIIDDIRAVSCLLEYLPSSICKDRIINTGTLGRDWDGIFSATPPEVLYEKPYLDYQYITGDTPNFHPIADGQKVSNGNVEWESVLPPTNREWNNTDWRRKITDQNILSTYPTTEPTDNNTIISSKEQFKKDKLQDDKASHLEQDLNVVRGDVQGVYGLKSEASSRKGISLGDSFAFEVWFKCAPDKNNAQEYYFNGNAVTNSFIIYTGNTESNKLVGFAYNSSGSYTSLFSYDDTTFTNKYTHIAMAYDGNILQCAVNGVLKEITFPDLRKPANRGLWIEGKAQVSVMRSYNINKFSQQQIDALYNQGRCDEVVLGDEWRNTINVIDYNNTDAPKMLAGYGLDNILSSNNGVFNVNYTSTEASLKGSIYTNIVFNAIGNLLIEFEYKSNCAIHMYMGSDFGYFNNHLNVLSINSEYTKISIHLNNLFDYRCLQFAKAQSYIGDVIYSIRNLKVSTINILNEYLPQYLTQTKWIDNGVNKQDIPLTAPTFSYVKPYKQYSSGSGTPTTLPEAAFIEYGDIDSGNIWKCKPKPNTRQFTTSDWKQITNV